MTEMNSAQPDALNDGMADTLGMRLRRARERQSLSLVEVAAKLKMSSALVEALEREDFERFGAPVYARGYLLSYLRLLGLPELLAEPALNRARVRAPELQSGASISPLRHYFDRYAMRSVYVVLTGAIIVPVLWLAVQRPGLVPLGEVRSLDHVTAAPNLTASVSANPSGESAAPHAPSVPSADAPSSELLPASDEPVLPQAAGGSPVMASMTPFYSATVAESRDARESSQVQPSENEWVFRFKAESWVEIVDHQGARLVYGIVPAGEEKSFPTDRLSRVALGNAEAVDVIHAGQSVNLEPFRRANVARFAISSKGAVALADRDARSR